MGSDHIEAEQARSGVVDDVPVHAPLLPFQECDSSGRTAPQATQLQKRYINWKKIAKVCKLKLEALQTQYSLIKAENKVLHKLAHDSVRQSKLVQWEQAKSVADAVATSGQLVDSAAILLEDHQLKEQLREQDAQLVSLRQHSEKATAIYSKAIAALRAELLQLKTSHSAETAKLKAQHMLELSHLPSQLRAEQEKRANIVQQLDRERRDAQGMLHTLGESRMEATWKRKVQQLKAEIESLKEEVAFYKRS